MLVGQVVDEVGGVLGIENVQKLGLLFAREKGHRPGHLTGHLFVDPVCQQVAVAPCEVFAQLVRHIPRAEWLGLHRL